MLQIPWVFLEGLPLLGMVLMLVVSLLNSLQEAMLVCDFTVLIVSKHFLPMQNEKLGSTARFQLLNKLWQPMELHDCIYLI